MRIAIIGAGKVGTAVGAGWARAGHEIVLGVRDPKNPKLDALVPRVGGKAVAQAEAARDAEVVVLALPWRAAEEVVKALGDLSKKIVIDCMNPLVMTPDGLGLDRGFSASGAEAVAAWLPGARVVKTLNQVGAEIMADASGFPVRPVMFAAGDDADAKATVLALLGELGFEGRDAGSLRQARLLEPLGLLWISQAMIHGAGRDWAFGVLRRAT